MGPCCPSQSRALPPPAPCACQRHLLLTPVPPPLQPNQIPQRGRNVTTRFLLPLGHHILSPRLTHPSPSSPPGKHLPTLKKQLKPPSPQHFHLSHLRPSRRLQGMLGPAVSYSITPRLSDTDPTNGPQRLETARGRGHIPLTL